MLGAILGGLFGGPAGVVVGGALGSLFGEPVSLREALRRVLEAAGARLISIRHYGPRVVTCTYAEGARSDFVRSEAPSSVSSVKLQDWLYADLVNQLRKRGVVAS